MKAEITQNVIQDLLPLYLAGEVSTDTATLVEAYLETDPELAEITRQATHNGFLKEVPVPLRKEDAMDAYKHARWSMVVKVIGLAVVVFLSALFALVCVALAGGVYFLNMMSR
jgi:anti-sigma factor RsiW